MSPGTSAAYRFDLAQRSLDSARDNFQRSKWRDSALFSRAAVEHATKALLACYAAVPRTHEPEHVLRLALTAPGFPAALRQRAQALLPELAGLGVKEHILLSYGDEEHGIDPWSIVDEPRAQAHLRAAESVTALAADCLQAVGVRS